MIFYISLICLTIGFIYIVCLFFTKRKNGLQLEKNIKKDPRIAIIIPARNESKVIEELFISIKDQTTKIPSENVFVIVEEESDPTVSLVLKYHFNYFVRKKLNLKTKGYAMAELLEDLNQKNDFYDLYFIFDADNVLDQNYFTYMLKDYQKGYTISTGFRALKNRDHYFPICAGLTHYMINEIRNRSVLDCNGNLIITGTGYYINGRLIKEWGTFPFHSLTEDYESSLYYALHGISTHYQEKAIFYDEQPDNYQKSIVQRSRWIKGYLTNWLNYRKLLKKELKKDPLNPGSLKQFSTGIIPAIWIVVGLILMIINALFQIGYFLSYKLFIYLILFLLFVYFVLVLFTALLLYMGRKQLDLTNSVLIKTLLYHPIYLISYLHAVFVSLTKRNLGWDPITHGDKMKTKHKKNEK